MALDLSGVDEDMSDVVVTMQIPARKQSFHGHHWASANVVIVPSDSEDDENDELTVLSELDSPSADIDNDDCVIESYQPGASSVLPGAQNVAVLTVQPIVSSSDNVDVALGAGILAADSSGIQLTSNSGLVDSRFTTLDPDVVLTDKSSDVSLLLIGSSTSDSSKHCNLFEPQDSFQNQSMQCGSSSFSLSLDSQSPSSLCTNDQIFVNEALKFADTSLMFDVGEQAPQVTVNTSEPDVLKPTPLITSPRFNLDSVVFFDNQAYSAVPVSDTVSKKTCLPTQQPAVDNLSAAGCSIDMGICSRATDLSVSKAMKSLATVAIGNATSMSDQIVDAVGIVNAAGHELNSTCDKNADENKRKRKHSGVKSMDEKPVISTAVPFGHQNVVRSSAPFRLIVNSLSRHMASRHQIVRPGSSPDAKRRIITGHDIQINSTVSMTSGSSQSPMSTSVTTNFSPSGSQIKPNGQSLAEKYKRRSATNTCSSSSSSEANVTSVGENCISSPELSQCCSCNKQIETKQMSFCMTGHSSCGDCLQRHVKTLLASAAKGAVMCLKHGCQGYYLSSQLKNSLPSMVIEILEEKLNREYCADVSRMMSSGHSMTAAIDDRMSKSLATSDDDDGLLDLPKNWEKMAANEPFRKVELQSSSDEYNWVAAMFHQTMTWPRSHIVRICRVQNHTLWQFYIVKRRQMARDSGSDVPVVEKHLFHGTSRQAVDAICLNNFDWRLSGTHGTMFGQGSYFAKDAAYSHMYTDPPPGHSGPRHSLSASAPMYVLNYPPYSRSLFRASNVTGQRVRSSQGPKNHSSVPPMLAALPILPPLLGPPQSVPPPAHLPKGQDSAFFARILSCVQPAHQQLPSSSSSLVGRTMAFSTGSLPPSQIATHKASSTSDASSGSGGKQVKYLPLVVPPASKYSKHFQDTLQSIWHPHPHSSQTNKTIGGSSAANDQNGFPVSSSSSSSGVSAAAPPPPVLPPKAHYLPGLAPPASIPVLAPAPVIGPNSTQTSVHPGPDWSEADASSLLPSHSQHVMFLSRVLVGQSTVGCQEYRKPPPMDPSRPFGRCYDSCVNRTNNPTIYVLFNSAQCYPEYVIEYNNKLHTGDLV